MAFDDDGNRDARLALLVDAAGIYLLDRSEARRLRGVGMRGARLSDR